MDPVIHDRLKILTDAFMVIQNELKIVEDSITQIYIRELELEQKVLREDGAGGKPPGTTPGKE